MFLNILKGLITIVGVILYVLVAGFSYIWQRTLGLVRRYSPRAIRFMAGTWITRHSARLMSLAEHYMDIEIVVSPPFSEIKEQLHGPVFVVPNHQSLADIPLVSLVLIQLGFLDSRWIAKGLLGYVPPLCWALNDSRSGKVSRCGAKGDLEIIEETATYTSEDSACMVFFPEGSRFSPKKSRTLENILDAGSGGYRKALTRLSGYQVLWTTIDWQARPRPRVWWQFYKLWGSRVIVTLEVFEPADSQSQKIEFNTKRREQNALVAPP